ncbi:MAG: polyphosphate kinase 2 [Pseudomonadota bacterium]
MADKAKPFEGAISGFFEEAFPKKLRKRVEEARKNDVLAASYPYPKRLPRETYNEAYKLLQIELVKLQSWVIETGQRVVLVFEGRDAAGKGGTIKRFTENLNPRVAKVVALPKPTEVERGQWYFQRYIDHLPTKGEIVLFDRSWYNRAVVERVFGFSSEVEREVFFRQVTEFEHALVQDGLHLFKIWLSCGRGEQMRRMLARESDPLKQWKLSPIDVKGLSKWDDYSEAIRDMFLRSESDHAPWHIVRADDKRRARIGAIRLVLSTFDYAHKDPAVACEPDAKIVVAPTFEEEPDR